MAGLLDLMNEWLIRVVVLSSFAAHVFLVLFAGIRRRKAFSWRRLLLWLAYQVADWAATYALGNLSVGSTSREQQLVAFWAPFLLLHLGGPDNISAYSLEDNILSGRQVLNAGLVVVGASIVLYKHVYIGGSGTLLWASVIMFAVGVAKYLERSWALWQGDLGRIRSTVKKQKHRRFLADQLGCCQLDDEKALLVAHDLFPICKGAFADYSHPLNLQDDRRPLPLKWRDMCKVVEMELSLMYDILYTKAAVVHTWHGYIIRVLSPPLTAAASLLFFYYSKDGQRRVDVFFTYILLAATFLLDMIWLLGALRSTWTYAYLHATCWLHHAFLCTGRWHRFRRLVVSLWAPCSSNRMWSGTIGQYNLLHECTRGTPTGLRSKLGELAKWVGLEDYWNEYQYHYLRGRDISAGMVRELLFKTIRESLKKAHPVPVTAWAPDDTGIIEEEAYHLAWALVDREIDENLNFDPEFQEVILIWHIATDVFLLCRDQNAESPKDAEEVIEAIEALSDYMVFIVAVRPDMLPGLKLKSTQEGISNALAEIWCNERYSSSSSTSPGSTTRKKKLARILGEWEDRIHPNTEYTSELYDKSIILSDGTRYAKVLQTLLCGKCWVWENHNNKREKRFRKIFEDFIVPSNVEVGRDYGSGKGLWKPDGEDDKLELKWEGTMEKMLEHILEAWVRLLIFVSVRCSRDSHAKQLSRGGELTTLVWILEVHAGIFGIDK